MPHSHHSHSGQFCRHAKDTLRQVVEEAVRQGFTTFGLSEHAPRYRREDLFPEEADLTPRDLEQAYLDFLDEAIRLRTLYSDRISLLIGLETDYITALDLTGTTSLLQKRPEIDYIVGSVHHVNGVSIDFDRSTWIRAVQTVAQDSISSTMTVSPTSGSVSLPNWDTEEMPSTGDLRKFLLAYFDAQYDMLRAHRPEVVGHFDLCLLWTPEVSLKDSQMDGVWDSVVRNVEFVISYGGMFEANAAAIRKGWTGSYPNPDVLQLVLDKNGRICLSDDSHGVAQVGLNYTKMRRYLVEQGVEEIWHLAPQSSAQGSDRPVGGRDRVRARKMERWADDPFWASLDGLQATR